MLIHFKHSSCLFLCRIRMSPLKLFFFFYWRSPRQALAWRHAVLILDYSLENTEARCTKPGIDSPVQLWNLKLYKILFSCSPWISEAKQVVVNFNLNISIFFIFFFTYPVLYNFSAISLLTVRRWHNVDVRISYYAMLYVTMYSQFINLL